MPATSGRIFNPAGRSRNFTIEQASVLDFLILHVVVVGSDNVVRFIIEDEEYAYYLEVLRIARQVPGLQIMVSIGGDQSFSDFFPSTMNDTEERKSLVDNLANLMNETGLSGVNIWWNQPVIVGFQEDRQNYVKFLRELRAKFNTFPRPMAISILTPKSHETITYSFELAGIAEHVDFIMSMSYGYYSPRMENTFTGPCNPIFKSRPNETSYLHLTMKALACGSNQPKKVNVGLGFYGWRWGRVSSDRLWEMEDMFRYKKGMTFDSQFLRWRRIVADYNLSLAGYNDRAKTMYYYDQEREIYIGTENERSFWEKLHYADLYGMGGVSISAIDGDDDTDTLFNIIKKWKSSPCKKTVESFRCMEDAEDVVANPVFFPLNRRWLQKQRQCCDSFVGKITMDNGGLNCSSLDSGKSPAMFLVDKNGHGNGLYKDYFGFCVLDNGTANIMDCCKQNGVDAECIDLCNIDEHNRSAQQLAEFYKRNCSIRAQEMAAHCTYLQMEWARKMKNGEQPSLESRTNKQKRWLKRYGTDDKKSANHVAKWWNFDSTKKILLSSIIMVVIAIIFLVPVARFTYKQYQLHVAMDTSLILLKELGKGQYGTVNEANWMSKKVAAKILMAESSRELKHEYSILNLLDHENICKVLHVTIYKNKLALIMEFAELGCLQLYLYNLRPASVGSTLALGQMEMAKIAQMIANGLNYLTINKILHRDLSCRNCLVFIKPQETEVSEGSQLQIVVKISDFGLARNLEKKSSYYAPRWMRWLKTPPEYAAVNTGSEENVHSCGAAAELIPIPKLANKVPTLNAAPECIKHRKYTFQSDIWSFGILLVEIFQYGQPPYSELSLEKATDEILAGRHPKIPAQMPAEMVNLMQGCCRFEPADRMQIGQVVNALNNLLLNGFH